MGELRSKAGAGGYSGQKEWVKSMVDYLAAPTAGPAHIRDLQSCSTSTAAKYLKAFVLSQCRRLST